MDAPNVPSNSTTNHGNLQGFLCSLAILGSSTVPLKTPPKSPLDQAGHDHGSPPGPAAASVSGSSRAGIRLGILGAPQGFRAFPRVP